MSWGSWPYRSSSRNSWERMKGEVCQGGERHVLLLAAMMHLDQRDERERMVSSITNLRTVNNEKWPADIIQVISALIVFYVLYSAGRFCFDTIKGVNSKQMDVFFEEKKRIEKENVILKRKDALLCTEWGWAREWGYYSEKIAHWLVAYVS